jgi:hypothetical protein
MNTIFTTTDKTERTIRLTKTQWSHIRQDHPNVTDYQDIKTTIENPIKTILLEKQKIVYYNYFKHRNNPAKYLKVIAKLLNGEGFVITAHFQRTIK